MCSRGSKLASREESAIRKKIPLKKNVFISKLPLPNIPANSMEAPSELVVGQAVQTSAAETKKAKRLWQKMEDTQKQFKKLKANYAKLVKSEASSSVILDRLKNDLEKAREAKRLQEQKVEQQKLMINTLQQLSRKANRPLKKRRIPGNSMADQPEFVEGNQNDQAAQPSAANQNNQLVQLSADKNKKEKKREADKKYRDGKKKQNETLIADKAKLKRKLASTKAKLKRKLASKKASLASTKASLAYKNGKLDQLKEDMEQTRETCRIQKQMVETQYIMMNMLQQHGDNVEQPAFNYGGYLSGSLDLLNNSTYPPGTGTGDNVEQPAYTYGGDLPGEQ
ncbi:hypothetical protein NC651_031517 [Populus alba x Populus x berolinensis]|nr:hypothetical protein NC651_031517 [Populus alba x Populus x berolinensis]